MSHLSPAEFVDFAEGTLGSERARHLETCGVCRAQAATVRDVLRATGGSDVVPEPSPLFWDHLSARIRAAVAAERPRSAFGFGMLRLQPIVLATAALVILVAVLSAAMLTRGWRQEALPERIATMASNSAVVPSDTTAIPEPDVKDPDVKENDEVWAVLTAAAADLQLDEARAAGIAVQPATIDHAVQRLTAAELAELGRLLQSELKRSSN